MNRILFKKYLGIIIIFLLITYILCWIPWVILKNATENSIHNSLDNVQESEVAIVFGGLHDENKSMSETNQERLLASKLLLDRGLVKKIIVSNAGVATEAMRDYLVSKGVSEDKITLDTKAFSTLDTCKNEKERGSKDGIIFVSHGYHLPRIIYQCNKENVHGIGLSPDKLALIEREEVGQISKIKIRFLRHQREAFLTLSSLLGIY